jgi:hypothetical protein
LDNVEVFNSNSPEIVQGDGILLSTFPSTAMTAQNAHLDHELNGRVDFFLHQINNRIKSGDEKTVQLAVIAFNNGKKAAHIRFLSGASYLSQPDAPFVELPASTENDLGNIFAGPGDRVSNDIINNRRDEKYYPEELTIKAGQYALLFQAPIPVSGLQPPLNGRTTLFKIETDEPLFAAELAKIQEAPVVPPTLADWLNLLKTAALVEPREKQATPLTATTMIYGRVAGVATGSNWRADLTNDKAGKSFDVLRNQSFSTVVDTVARGSLGTGQIQSAPLVCRYNDTAFSAHGNYGIWYKLHIPIKNIDSVPLNITVSFDTPIKNDVDKDTLRFFEKPAKQVFFRGTIRAHTNTGGQLTRKSIHLVEHRGEKGAPLIQVNLEPKKKSDLYVDFIYPADATPPQVLTVHAEPITAE